ncbi:MAG TPA: SDR family NAD(P)-dependent oxidoreductase [Methanomicrobiales archaeon]|nr:SDR family NAD(P)-dependent oxidoreductase [Methanomicrobiales archaeon]
MSWKERRVLVTGAGGFIGTHLVDALVERGAQVTALVRYNSRSDWGMLEERYRNGAEGIRVILGDVTDAGCVRKAVEGNEVVFHLAALIGIPYSYEAPESYVRTNTLGTLNVLSASLSAGVERMVHTSTSEVYGTALYTPIDEAHPLQGQSPYSASKIAADKMAEAYYCSFGLPVVTLRPFNTYGPRQSARAVIPTMITQALTSKTVQLGSLEPVRDFTFVTDTARAFILAAERDDAVGKTIHTGSGIGISIGELAQRILAQVNPGARIITGGERVRPGKSEVMRLVCDSRRAWEELGWRPEVSLDEGLSRTIAWIREHLDNYKAGRYAI